MTPCFLPPIADAGAGAARAPMKLIVVANAKGGCGKTTLATTLAGLIAASGGRTALADLDPSRCALAWLARRPSRARPVLAFDWTRRGAVERGLAAAAAEGIDWLIVDTPPGDGALRRKAGLWNLAARADAVIAPVAQGFFEDGASLRFLSLLESALAQRRSAAELQVVANRVRFRSESGPARAFGSALTAAGVEPAAMLGDRRVYASLAARGLSVFDRTGPRLETARRDWAPLAAALGIRLRVEPSGPLAARAPAGGVIAA